MTARKEKPRKEEAEVKVMIGPQCRATEAELRGKGGIALVPTLVDTCMCVLCGVFLRGAFSHLEASAHAAGVY